jgi:acyl transferase domain-containing protein
MGARAFLEIGPHPGLVRYVTQVLRDTPGVTPVGTLRRNEDGPRCLAQEAAALYAAGVRLTWGDPDRPTSHRPFPSYPWHREQVWTECDDSRHPRLTGPTHPLLGAREPGPDVQRETCLSAERIPYLADHGFRAWAVFRPPGPWNCTSRPPPTGRSPPPSGWPT